ncbi:hypothetical protein CY35_03G059600 [Sphagnum magellanicum]|nr:hypothetical protein CY35_03G059600 [Sphagnum magellanicum]
MLCQCCSNLQEIIMEHLPFTSAFWVLQVIVSLRCKFQGVYTQKQLLGSKKCAGIIQACLPILLTTPVTLHRDVFKEFFWHNRFCHLGEDLPSRLSTKVCQDSGNLQLVNATGALDVMIPDLQCFANLSSTYQITSFSLVVEGKWRTSTQSAEANCASADCQTLLWHGLHYSRGWSSRRSLQICFHTMCISKYSMLPASKTLYGHQGKLVQAILVG